MSYFVYLHKNSVNGKIYIGYTDSLKNRWAGHLSDARRGLGYYFHAAIRKHGGNVWETSVLETFDTESEALKAEMKWIAHYHANDPKIGYNLTSGGETYSHAESTKEKLSNKALVRNADPEYRKMTSDRTKEAMSKLSEDKKAKMLVDWTPELREKASNSAKERCTEEWRKKHSEVLKEREVSEEDRQKMSESWTEEKRELFRQRRLGKKVSEETRTKIGEASKALWTEERKQAYSERMKRQKPSPETLEKRRQKMLELWSDPVRREEYLLKRKRGNK